MRCSVTFFGRARGGDDHVQGEAGSDKDPRLTPAVEVPLADEHDVPGKIGEDGRGRGAEVEL